MSNENEESILSIIDRKLNLGQYRKILFDQGMFNSNKLFSTPLSVLSYSTQVPLDIFEQVLSIVSEDTIPQITEIEYSEPRPRFNDPILDQSIILPESGIIELCGQASAGKSNIAYHLAVQERIYDMTRKVVLISTEGKVPTQRVHQIAESANSLFGSTEIMNGILITEADSVKQLNDLIQNDLVCLFFSNDQPPPSMVIIDSIAALFRIEYDINSSAERTRLLFDITATLKWISATSNTLIIVTNQATANLTAFSTNSNDWIPSLGFSWSNCINVRIRVTKTQMKHQAGPLAGPVRTTPGDGEKGTVRFPGVVPVRTMYVEISPIKQDARVELFIDNAGVHGI
ncbi:DNA repair protein XRCC3-like protein [Tritrichomonas foetus]|uniref:DNA repair protein XRCC3-like protein n=1 Tax=Tritrichomonas foetus TaxID=1144522 RepID=A0A1J4KP77_9EUKA|nr:DNA repair protein XRCC3-like protein [Tritrichomonas foetus]|eukprot:OHT11229.1 DNA repair protein XRCC3-like protein [Tritrichomonas foetus]